MSGRHHPFKQKQRQRNKSKAVKFETIDSRLHSGFYPVSVEQRHFLFHKNTTSHPFLAIYVLYELRSIQPNITANNTAHNTNSPAAPNPNRKPHRTNRPSRTPNKAPRHGAGRGRWRHAPAPCRSLICEGSIRGAAQLQGEGETRVDCELRRWGCDAGAGAVWMSMVVHMIWSRGL